MRLPDDSKRLVLLGSTGTGKSQAGLWHLSNRSFDKKPWFVFDPKLDGLIDSLGATEFDFTGKLPKKPGLYRFSPVPSSDDLLVEDFLHRAITSARDGNPCGFYFDEGYSIPKNSRAFRRILTQGRSMKSPAITLSQRPFWMDRFVWSEADFIQYLFLFQPSDRQTVSAWFPEKVKHIIEKEKLPSYFSLYYDVGKDEVTLLKPVPSADEIRDTFRRKLKTLKVGKVF